jgi:hypothetical protein
VRAESERKFTEGPLAVSFPERVLGRVQASVLAHIRTILPRALNDQRDVRMPRGGPQRRDYEYWLRPAAAALGLVIFTIGLRRLRRIELRGQYQTPRPLLARPEAYSLAARVRLSRPETVMDTSGHAGNMENTSLDTNSLGQLVRLNACSALVHL